MADNYMSRPSTLSPLGRYRLNKKHHYTPKKMTKIQTAGIPIIGEDTSNRTIIHWL